MYARNPRPSLEEQAALAARIGESVQRTRQWFSHQRHDQTRVRCREPQRCDAVASSAAERGADGLAGQEEDAFEQPLRPRAAAAAPLPVAPCAPCGTLSEAQTALLRAAFARSAHPTQEERQALASHLGLSVTRVNSWFSHKLVAEARRNKRKHAGAGVRRGGGRAAPVPYPPECVAALRAAYDLDARPSVAVQHALAAQVGLTQVQVSSWFSYTRNKLDTHAALLAGARRDGRAAGHAAAKCDGDAAAADADAAQRTPAAKRYCVRTPSADADAEEEEEAEVEEDAEEDEPLWAAPRAAQSALPASHAALLRAALARSAHPTREERRALASQLGLSAWRVGAWFRHMRHAERTPAQEPQQTGGGADGARRSKLGGAMPFPPQVLAALRAAYAACALPSSEAHCALATHLGLTSVQVKNWFHYTRRRDKASGPQGAHADVAQRTPSAADEAHAPPAKRRRLHRLPTPEEAEDEEEEEEEDAGAMYPPPPPPLSLASLAPLCLRRRDLAALAATPAAVFAPYGGLAALLCRAYVRVRARAAPRCDQPAAAHAYRLAPVRGAAGGNGGAAGALHLRLPTEEGPGEPLLQWVLAAHVSDHKPLTEAEGDAAVAAATAARLTHAELQERTAALATALLAADAVAAFTANAVRAALAAAGVPPSVPAAPPAPPPPPRARAPPAVAATAAAAAAPAAPPAQMLPCWHYATHKGVQGPFSLHALASFREHLTRIGRWGTLRVWRTGETEADAVLLASLLPEAAAAAAAGGT